MPPAVGSRLSQNNCTFTVWAPFKKSVELVIQHRDAVPMEPSDHGYWTAVVSGIHAGTQYRFKLDGAKPLPDPASRAQPEGVHGPSSVVEEAFPWTDEKWTGLPLGDMVIYELHVGTFTPAGDFSGIIEKLPYLQDLGINAIELMPVAQFPGRRNWGYDGVYPFAVQDSYGGAIGLKQLVNAAHNAGIAVILDVVYNHQGPEGNYLSEYGPYFTDKYKTGWGQAINFDDAWCDGVRNFYWQNALMWLDEFRIDGLRLDAVHAIWDFSAHHFVEELAEKVEALEQARQRKKVLIAEFDLNNPRYIQSRQRGGYGLHGQWIDEFHHALHSLVTGETNGYYEDFGGTEHMTKALRDAYVYTGQYSQHRKKRFGREPVGTTYDQFVVFAQNHDQTGNRMLGDRLAALTSHEGLKLAAATYLLSPAVPMLFMGEEYGERKPFQYFISHTDDHLVELVRKGRKAEFAYFKWQGEVPDPQAEKTFSDCILSWAVTTAPDAKKLFEYYKWLIDFRRRPAMQGRTRDSLRILSAAEGIICYERRGANGDRIVVVLNFNKHRISFQLPSDAAYRACFDSAASVWNGPRDTPLQSVGRNQPFDIFPESAMIFES